MRVHESADCGVAEYSLDDLRQSFDGRFTHSTNRAYSKTVADRDYEMRTGSSWYAGLRSTSEATAILERGWRDGAKRLESTANDIAPPEARSRKRRTSWSDQGDELRIDHAMAGNWDSAWRTSKRVWSAGPSHVTVFGTFGGNAYRDPDALFWSGAAALIVTDRLESAGYPVRLVASRPVRSSHCPKALRLDIVVKESEDPLQVDALASLVCHAGIFRSYGFAAILGVPGELGSGLGSEATWDEHKSRYEAAGEWPEGAIVMEGAYDRASCLAAINKALVTVTGGEL